MNTDIRSRPAPATPPTVAPPRRTHRLRWLAALVLVPLALAGAGLWWFVFRGEAPPPASLDQALAGVAAPASSSTASAVAAGASSVDGTWTIDRSITNAQGSGAYAGFRVNEVLSGVGSATAVGRTSNVQGTLTVDGTTLTAATIDANLTAVTTDDSRRDGAVQRALDTSRFPNATFVLTEPVDVGSVPAEGQRITAAATGDLTIHGVTRQVTLDVQAQLQNGVLVVVGSTDVAFSDYGVTAPTAPIVASVDDHALVELQLYFVKR
jgi:polyisoprenoid-binding protein YceI